MKGIGGHTLPGKGASDSWITPRHIVDALGQFDLDPCQCVPQPWPCAENFYTIYDNGLDKDWYGRVWLNPPYSEATAWLARLSEHGRGTALIFARTETEMFQRWVWQEATAILFLYGRLFFHHPTGERAKGNSGGPSALVAYGEEDAEALRRSGLRGALCSGWGQQLEAAGMLF